MKNILVIGNGFDIAHGLYTKYIDFYNFCNAIKRVINDKREIAISFYDRQIFYLEYLNDVISYF